MTDILLATLNATYAHAAFGLRYLRANLGPLMARCAILEFDISQRPLDIAEAILSCGPRIVGLGVYIWNASATAALVADLKRIRPDLIIILGGPEVSFETDRQEICALADHVIRGEGEHAFADLCGRILAGQAPSTRIIDAAPAEPATLALPYDLYTEHDLAQRVVYVETSRGCPFGCEFCLSSLDRHVRYLPLEPLLAAFDTLIGRGLRRFKFVDRTFNLDAGRAARVLRFFLDRSAAGPFVHLEMIPDRLPDDLRDLLARFPAGSLQLEVGIQSFNPAVCASINRRQDADAADANLRWLRQHTGVHIHADLIAGLPGEDLASFAAGFDRLVACRPQEIQLGILKRLRGAPIARHEAAGQLVFSPHPPYEVLQTQRMDFQSLQQLRRFGRFWDMTFNSGSFAQTAPLLIEGGSPFDLFGRFCQHVYKRFGKAHAIALDRLAEALFEYLTRDLGRDPNAIAASLWADYQRCGRSDRPAFLRGHLPDRSAATRAGRKNAPPRQSRHL